ncbi:MAG: nicotinamide riboside transporter PnuC [Betaproteobacteria bacterium]
MSPLEIAGFILSVFAVWLTARQHILCWPIGILSVAVYAVIFVDVKLYSDAGLQVIFAFLQVYGWYAWLTTGPTPASQRPVGRTVPAMAASLLLIGIAGTAALGYGMATRTDAALPWWDAGTTVFSLVAQWLTARKAIESWPLWIIVDIVYVGIYIAKDLQLTAVLYAIFIALAFYGWQQWHSDLRSTRPA